MHQQAGEQVEAAVPPEVADRRRAAVAHVEQPGLRHPLQGLADGGPGDAEHLGEAALAGQRLSGTDTTVDHLGQDLVEDLVGDRASAHGLQRHAGERRHGTGRWSSGQTRSAGGRTPRPAAYAGVVHRSLAPRLWAAHLLALVLVGAAAGLGFWQLDAWREHRRVEATDLTRADPLPLDTVIGPDDPFPGNRIGQPVTVAGTWVPAGTVFISGREHGGHEGYWVVTPLAVGAPDGAALPVVRGWVADPGDAPDPPTGPAELQAWLQPPEGTGQADDDPSDDVLPQLRIADVIQHVDQDLYGAYGVAEAPGPGLEPASLEQLPEVDALTGLRNLLYAIEWWFFGAFALFIWWRWVTEEPETGVETERADQPSGVGP